MNKFLFSGIGLLFGVLIGFAAGALLTQDDPAEPLLPSASQLEPATGTEIQNPEKAANPLPAPDTPPSGTALSDIITKTEVPTVPSGNGTITGKVLTDSGEPVSGVEISARPSYPQKRTLIGKNTEQRIADTIRFERWKELSRRETTTDEKGEYTLEGLHATEAYKVGASLADWQLKRIGGRGRVEAGAEVDFVATRVYLLSIEVRMPDGSLADDVYVRRTSKKTGTVHRVSTTDGRGEIKLGADTWFFGGYSGENREYSVEKKTVTIGPESAVKQVMLQLKGKPGVKGTVKIPSKYKDLDLRVYLVKDPPAEAPGDIKTLLKDDPESEFLRGGNGYYGLLRRARLLDERLSAYLFEEEEKHDYTFVDVEAGQYRLILVLDSKIADWADITIGDNLETVDLELPEPKRSDYIVVTVRAPAGGLLDNNISINLTVKYGYSSDTAGVSIVSGDDNEYWIHRRKPKPYDGRKVTKWTYNIEVTHSKYGSLVKTLKHDDTAVQEFQFSESANATVTVSGYNEHESRKQLRCRLVSSRNRKSRWWFADVDDAKNKSPFTFGPIQPGTYQLILEFGKRFERTELYREEFIIQPGKNPITITMPQIYSLTVNCKDSKEARLIKLTPDWYRRGYGKINKTTDGKTVTFSGILAGEYILKTETGRMKVTVPTDGPIDFVGPEYDCFILSGIKRGGIIESLGLMNNDKLIEIDGFEFTTTKVFRAHYRVALSKHSTAWVVVRNGGRTSVMFNGKSLMEALENRRENGEDLDLNQGYRNE